MDPAYGPRLAQAVGDVRALNQGLHQRFYQDFGQADGRFLGITAKANQGRDFPGCAGDFQGQTTGMEGFLDGVNAIEIEHEVSVGGV